MFLSFVTICQKSRIESPSLLHKHSLWVIFGFYVRDSNGTLGGKKFPEKKSTLEFLAERKNFLTNLTHLSKWIYILITFVWPVIQPNRCELPQQLKRNLFEQWHFGKSTFFCSDLGFFTKLFRKLHFFSVSQLICVMLFHLSASSIQYFRPKAHRLLWFLKRILFSLPYDSYCRIC